MKTPKARKLGSGTWFIQLRLGGESVSVTAATETECTRQAQLIKAEYLAGKRAARVKESRTLGKVVEDYIAHHENVLSPSSVRGFYNIRRNRFKEWMHRHVSEITDWQTMISAEAAKVSPKTVSCAWGLVARALKVEAGMVAPNVKLPQVPVKEIPFLQPEEILPFVDAIHGNIAEIPALLELHGLRRSEALGLDWKDVDLKRGLLHIRGAVVQNKDGAMVKKATTKNASSTRTIPIMIPQLAEALKKVDKKEGPVVTVVSNTMLRNVKEACKTAGITVVGNHGLRHSFASLGYHLGISERELMRLGGWADFQTMHKIYVRVAAQDEAAARNAITGFFSQNANQNAN